MCNNQLLPFLFATTCTVMGPPPDAPCDPALVLQDEEYIGLLDYVVGKANMVQLQLACGRAFRLTPKQHAVLHFTEAFRRARTELEQEYVCKALARALGAERTEVGTTNAIRCVLLQLLNACESATALQMVPGARRSTFDRWRTCIHKARLDMREDEWILISDRERAQAYRLF